MSSGAWLGIALAALFGVQFTLHPYLAYPTAAVALWLLRQRLSPYARLLIMLVAVACGYRSSRTINDFLVQREGVRQQIGAAARCAGEGEVVQSPLLRDGKLVLVVQARHLRCDNSVEGEHRVRLVAEPTELGRGDCIAFVAQLGPVAPLRQIELSSPIPRLASQAVVASGGALDVELLTRGSGWRHWVDAARAGVRRRILATYAPKAQGLGRALVLGENDLDPDEQLAFQRSGLSHLLAVSGTHLVFAVVSLVAGLRSLLLRFSWLARRCDVARGVAPVGACIALLYADFAGGSGSAWRAAWMLAALYLATACDRRLGGLRALAISIVIGSIYDPLASYDVSFLLSALATSGLVVLGPALKPAVERVGCKPLRWLAGALATTTAAMLPCVPLLLLLSPEISLAGLFANVVAGPLGETAALPLCLLHTLLAPLPWVERGAALAGSGALLAVGAVARASAGLTWARLALPPPTVEQFAVMGVGVVAAATVRGSNSPDTSSVRVRRLQWLIVLAAAGSLLLLELVATRTGAPRGQLRLTAVDVGQGDSLLVDLPDGRLMLIDGGGAITGGPDPGQRVLLPLLRARRRHRIDIAVLTHPHPDHFGGLLFLLREFPVLEFWEAGDRESRSDSDLGRLRRDLQRKGVRLRHFDDLCRAYPPLPGALIQVLGPCPDVPADRQANDQSLVIRLEWGAHSVLLPGDAEYVEETDLLASHGPRLHATVLKVGHHGSRSSTSAAWLEAVRPAMAVISTGLRNRFGHPHPTTLTHLAALNIPIYRTDELGSIEWTTDGAKITVRTAASRPPATP